MNGKQMTNDHTKKSICGEIDFKLFLKMLMCIVAIAEIVIGILLKAVHAIDAATFTNFSVVLCCYEVILILGFVHTCRKEKITRNRS